MDITGKAAIVTGASAGIGRATALALARAGARGIMLADIDAAGLADVTTRTFLRKKQARPLMRSLAHLNEQDLAKVLAVAEELARKHHPDTP